MKFYNLKENDEQVSFAGAVKQGLGRNQGLFFPEHIPSFDNIKELLALPLVERSVKVLYPFVSDDLTQQQLTEIVTDAFNFPAQIQPISEKRAILELFHGPTLAFKDFGARFMAKCLQAFSQGKKITILTATSGDTGAAVAHAFHDIDNIDVVILYPKGKISLLQEKMFTTLGGNIKTVAIEGTFDDCQALVKQSFDDQELKETIGLNSANSINIARLIPQSFYYLYAYAQLKKINKKPLAICVPSGNFGNLTAGLIAKKMGLPIKKLIAATNANDPFPIFLQTGHFKPKESVKTLSNAMDVGNPSNFVRILELYKFNLENIRKEIESKSYNDEETLETIRELYQNSNYILEPHGAIGYMGIKDFVKNHNKYYRNQQNGRGFVDKSKEFRRILVFIFIKFFKTNK